MGFLPGPACDWCRLSERTSQGECSTLDGGYCRRCPPQAPSISEISPEETPEAEQTREPVSVPAEPAAPPIQPASPTATYMNPGEQYGEVCYSGTPDQWPNFVNPATGCGAVLNPNYVEPAAEPYIVECLLGTPGPTLMSDGTTQYTDYCYQQGTSHPGYVDEGTITDRFWACMEAGGTAETCRQ